ncbi:MAG: tripartite tricarboxylate transporter TctB family protein [Pseudomonadota bacterium]
MSDKSSGPAMARADLLTGVVLLALGLAMLYGGFVMDRLEIRQIHPASIPGLVPMGLGIALAVCAVILLASAVRAGGLTAPSYAGDRAALLRLVLCMALCLTYPLILIGWLPFWLATSLFVTGFIAIFEWTPRLPRAHAIALATAILQGILVGVVTAYVFSELFLVRLP